MQPFHRLFHREGEELQVCRRAQDAPNGVLPQCNLYGEHRRDNSSVRCYRDRGNSVWSSHERSGVCRTMKTARFSLSANIGGAIFWTILGILSITLTNSLYVGIGCILLGVGFAVYAVVKSRQMRRHQMDQIDKGNDEPRS